MNAKQSEFVRQYFLQGRNATQAYMKAYKGVKRSVAVKNGSRLLTNADVKEAIANEEERLAEKYNITQEKMIDSIMELIYSCQQRENNFGESIDHKSWAKGLDMIARLTGQYAPDKLDIKGNLEIKLNDDEE